MGRTKIAVVNSGLSVANLVITNVLQFVYRTAIVYILGVEYAGISGLCQNVIGLFALSELGISWAISYYLYKPLKDGNNKEVAEIIFFLRKLYKYVGFFILTVGLATVPFLDIIIKGASDIEHLKIIFVLYLFNTAVSYLFFSYYQVLAVADRKNYILFAPQTIGNILMVSGQIIVIYFFHSFLAAVALTTVSTLIINYSIRRKVQHLYPCLQQYNQVIISSSLKKEIIRYIKATMLYKVSLTVMTSSTGIIISHFIGLAVLGLYSNYMLIVDTIRSLILSLINPMTSVVGEITTAADVEVKETVYNRLNFLMEWICSFCAIALYSLLSPFVAIWLGDDLTLPLSTVTLIAIYFYIEFIISFSTKFRDACGLNRIGKFRPLITAIVNVVLAIALAPKFGINGIISALIISRLTTLTWFEPWIVHHYVLNKSVIKYYLSLVCNFVFTVVVALGISKLIQEFCPPNVSGFIVACTLVLIIPNVLYYLFFRKKSEMKYYIFKFKAAIKH